MKQLPRIVIDTNVFLSALRSRQGASSKLLSQVGDKRFVTCISAPLIFEYEATAKREQRPKKPAEKDIDDILDYLCAVGEAVKTSYLWRPMAKDPQDEMLVELAVAGGCGRIITFNKRDLPDVGRIGIKLQTPKEFLMEMEK
ncbi:MAG TPA: putative toxin-antitoxin system toxin component, PIN family [Verrucomicrobia bacterium]|nr:MAG: putative toxin-antitoxin system toxin component, PIN family [Lentisphaerae bacterium GWF2_57_35]HBA86187.1 putative toxin-antitoxin system toxin component, PIN family [Verrucomicrobiota bacterium]